MKPTQAEKLLVRRYVRNKMILEIKSAGMKVAQFNSTEIDEAVNKILLDSRTFQRYHNIARINLRRAKRR